MTSTCRRCGGQGHFINTPCKKCRGKGKVAETKTITIPVPAGKFTSIIVLNDLLTTTCLRPCLRQQICLDKSQFFVQFCYGNLKPEALLFMSDREIDDN